MAKQLVEVEVPEGWELADRVMRRPEKGEFWLSAVGNVYLVGNPGTAPPEYLVGSTSHAVPILRPVWQWPAWLKAPWIAMCGETGHWWGYSNEPEPREGYRRRWTGGYETWLNPQLLDFTPPPCDDWKTSKRKNPNT